MTSDRGPARDRPMRTAIRFALLGLLLLPATGAAQSPRDKVQIRAARVGFPPGSGAGDSEEINLGLRQTLYKPGAWTPVYVDVINAGKYDRARDGDAEVVVETLDCDDTAHNYVVPLPPFDPQSNTSSVIT